MAFALTAKQQEAQAICASDATHILLFGGGRSAKTFLILRNIVLRALKAPGSTHAVMRFRLSHCVSSVVQQTFPRVMALAFPDVPYHVGGDLIARVHKSQVWFGGLDDKDRVDKILGQDHATLFFNECSQIPFAARETAITRLAQLVEQHMQNRQPSMLKPRCFYDENPPSKAHWSYKLFIQKVHPETKLPLAHPEDYVSMQMNPQDNAENLPAGYIDTLQALSARMRKRFLAGEFADATPNQLFTDEMIETWRHVSGELPDFVRVVVGVDPSGSGDIDNADNDEIGEIVAALGTDGNAYVLEDCSVKAGPATWGNVAVTAYDRHAADVIVGEVNYGGAMVEATIQTARRLQGSRRLAYKAVTATRGKVVRAEPISALYEQGKCVARGTLIRLERGSVPVERVRVGDMAWTRRGLKRVSWAGSLGEKDTVAVRTATGAKLRCSGEHPIYVEGNGFIRANNLSPSCDMLSVWDTDANRVMLPSPGETLGVAPARQKSDGKRGQSQGRLLYSMVSGITKTARAIGSMLARVLSTAIHGSSQTAPSQTDGRSITSMAILATTLSPIWSRSPMLATAQNIHAPSLMASSSNASVNHKNEDGKRLAQSNTSANSADVVLSQRERASGSARHPATLGIGVGSVESSARAEVFDLTVDGEGEYFANDILVHNCRHVGYFRELEDELSGFSTVGYLGDRSPNRADALIWALTELFPGVVAPRREKPKEKRVFAGSWQS